MPAPPPHDTRRGTRADALIATLGLSLLFLMLVCVFRAGAQDSRNYNVAANTNLNSEGNLNVARHGNSVLRGRVTYADTGQPIRRAHVAIYGAGHPSPTYTATNRAGEFAFKNLSGGRYFVHVESPGVISPFIYADESEDRTPFDMLAARRTQTDFIEATVNGTSDSYVEIRARRGGVITGKVLYEDGSPVAAARIQLFRRRNGAWKQTSFGTMTKPISFSSDARGVYRASGLPPGEYLVSASEPIVSTDGNTEGEDDAYHDTSLILNFHPDATNIAGAQVVRVGIGQETTEVDIRFSERELRTLSGTVTTRRKGEPIGSVVIKLQLQDPALTSTGYQPISTSWSDQQGHWMIKGVPDGLYRLKAQRYPEDEEAEGMLDEDERGAWRPRYYVPTEMEVKVEADMRNMSVKLAEAGTISGKLVVEGRKPLPAEAEVLLIPQSAPAPSAPLISLTALTELIDQNGLSGYGTTYEPETGSFLLWRVPAGNGYLNVLFPPDSTHYVKSLLWKGRDLLREPLRLAEGEEVTDLRIVLATGAGRVSGRVMLKEGSAEPARAVAVVLIPVDPVRRRIVGLTHFAVTDDEGGYLVTDAPGEYYLVALPLNEEELPALSEGDIRERAATLPRVTLKLKGEETRDLVLTETTPR
ncbi:MAG TPA: carboxypeptidase-like regulatory domain-containing protein [Pyrinomonadaceae bacterium]|nr:carboxypeptidase-like regulatory domain-containing protein [Pyrinomonadaceae bacterium]